MMKMTKTEKSWVLYDCANSAYVTIVVAAVFPIFFTSVCGNSGQSGDFWWGIGTTLSTGVVAIMAPIIGAIADYHGMKKKLFTFFLALGLLFTLVSAISDAWQWMLVGYIISNIGFTGSVLIYDSFITDVTTPERMDNISSWGYALGYIGGSTIPFLMSIVLVTFGKNFGINSALAVKLSLIITVLWWLIFSIPFLKNVEQTHGVNIPKKDIVNKTLIGIFDTFKNIFKDKALLVFMVAYFFYIYGVHTIISMATSYGSTLGLSSVGMILALLVTQVVAFPCAIIFGKLSTRFGSINMIKVAIIAYFAICVMGFIMGFGIEQGFLSLSEAIVIFWLLAVSIGTVQGGIQAISRSYFGKLIPQQKSSEYFGFFDIFGKFAAVMGPALYAFVKGITGRSSFSILSIIILFLIAFIILIVPAKTQ
jgi:UMF1 family MFS transporter